MYRIVVLLILSVIVYSSIAQNKQANSNKYVNAEFNSFFDYCHDNELFNGSVLIYRKDEVLFEKSFGRIGIESEEEISSETAFLLASISKQFTAFCIVHLHSKDLLDYDDVVQKYISEFPYPEVTIRQLLNHTSGIPEYMNFLNPQAEILKQQYEDSGVTMTNQRIASMFAKRKPPLNFKPGTDFDYSNTGYIYLAMIIESVSGKPYSAYLDQTIFKPLNMTSSWAIGGVESIEKEQAIGYKSNHINQTFQENSMPSFLKVYGDGGIYSSTGDLRKWYAALDNNTLVPENTMDEAYKNAMINGKKLPYGFGWFVRTLPFNQHRTLTHSGQFVGFTNSIFRNLDDRTTSIVLSNNSHDINRAINSAVVRILYNMPFEMPKQSAEQVLGHVILSKGIQRGKEVYRVNKENEDIDLSEKSLNSLGYSLLALNENDSAIEVFAWNVELHPTSANVYDSLAEAQLASGKKQEALANYQKAWSMDQTNTNAKKIIERLKSESRFDED